MRLKHTIRESSLFPTNKSHVEGISKQELIYFEFYLVLQPNFVIAH